MHDAKRTRFLIQRNQITQVTDCTFCVEVTIANPLNLQPHWYALFCFARSHLLRRHDHLPSHLRVMRCALPPTRRSHVILPLFLSLTRTLIWSTSHLALPWEVLAEINELSRLFVGIFRRCRFVPRCCVNRCLSIHPSLRHALDECPSRSSCMVESSSLLESPSMSSLRLQKNAPVQRIRPKCPDPLARRSS